MAAGTSDLSSRVMTSSGRPLTPPLALTYSTIKSTPLPVESAGAALNPVMLLENPTLMGAPVAGPAAVVSVLGAAVVSVSELR